MIGTPENPLAVPYDGHKEETVIPQGPQAETVTALQAASNTPAPRWPEGSLLAVDKEKGGTRPLAPGEDPSIAVAKVVNGVAVSLEQPTPPVQTTTKWYRKMIDTLLGKKAA